MREIREENFKGLLPGYRGVGLFLFENKKTSLTVAGPIFFPLK